MTSFSTLMINGRKQFFSPTTGAPLAGGFVYYYVPGTTTFKGTWQDSGQSTPNTNPIILDAAGTCLVYGSGTYREYVTDSLGNLIQDALTSDIATASQSATVYSSIASLRLFAAATPPSSVTVEGYYSATDSGGGQFSYVASDTTSADNGGTIIVDAAGHRWYRENIGLQPLSVVWFGAKGDGATDDTNAFKAAIASFGGKLGTVFAPPTSVSYLLSSKITLPGNVSIVGGPSKTQLKTAAGTYTLLSITGSNTTISNFVIDNTLKTGGVDISIDVAAGTIVQTRITDIISNGCFGLVADSGSASGIYYLTWIQRCVAYTLRGSALNLTRSLGFLYVDDCTADFIGSVAPNFAGFVLDNSVLVSAGVGAIGGSFWRGCDVSGTSTGVSTNTSQTGFFFHNTNEIWMNTCDADSCDGMGYLFSACADIHMSLSEAGLCNLHGIAFTGCSYAEVGNCKSWGRKGNSGVASQYGIAIITGCLYLTFTGVQILATTGDGINIASQSGPVNIVGGIVSGCGGWGINTAGTSAILASSLTFASNTTGNYNMAGGNQWLQASQLSAGNVVSVGPGPING